MLKKFVSAELTAKDLNTIKDCLENLHKLLPFLITLSAEERQKLFKAGDKSAAFLTDCLLAAQNNPSILPATFDVDGFEKNVTMLATLNELCTLVAQLANDLADTKLAVGSDAIHGGTEVYQYVKAASNTVPGLKTVEEKLRPRFAKSPRKPKIIPVSKAA